MLYTYRLLALLSSSLMLQPLSANSLWLDVPQHSARTAQTLPLMPDKYRLLKLDETGMRLELQTAPVEWADARSAQPTGAILSLPMPDGSMVDLSIQDSPIMEAGLAEKFPNIKTYTARGVGISGRLDMTEQGFHGLLNTPQGDVFIDPRGTGTERKYISYYKKDYQPADKNRSSFSCGVSSDQNLNRSLPTTHAIPDQHRASGEQLRTYRLAVAATGEYTAFHGGTKSAALAAITTTINRVNVIYERDVSVKLQLIANNNNIIYTSSSDPYSNGDGITMLAQNQTTLDNVNVIGSANYDIGHVFSTGGGGVATVGSVCNSSSKARGVTGNPTPIGDPFDIDYVAHEIGHQFSGYHTFNGSAGNCGGGNRSASTSYEPGSGSTIMSYAGICNPVNLQANSDAMFHAGSIKQIIDFTTLSTGNNCAAITSLANTAPTVNAGNDYTIPARTPFELTGTATDTNPANLTYAWEQMDLGTASSSLVEMVDNGNRPLFRSFLPTASPTRSFPKLLDLINNTQTIGEYLPTTNRTLDFRLTVRDGENGVNSANTQITVDSASGPFAVTVPNGGENYTNLSTVTWNTASTNVGPVNCGSVEILMSLNNGYNFPIILNADTINDGTEPVTFPQPSTTARVKVKCKNNVFFDISDNDFTIASTINKPPIGISDPYTIVQASINNSLDVLFNDTDPDTVDTKTIIQVSAPDKGGKVVIDGLGNGNKLLYTPLNNFHGTETFDYMLRDTAGAVATGNVTVTIIDANGGPTAVNDTANVANSSGLNTIDVLNNDLVPGANNSKKIVSISAPTKGGKVFLAGTGINNKILYMPKAGYQGTETFTYEMQDSSGDTSVATVTIRISGSIFPPNSGGGGGGSVAWLTLILLGCTHLFRRYRSTN